jgi:polyphosphate kinase 2
MSTEPASIENDSPATDEVAEEPDHYLSGEYIPSISKKIRKDPTAIGRLFKEGKYPYLDKIDRKKYEKEKAKLQIELLKVQNWVKMSGQKIVVIFEGRDAAGKGGTIKRFMEHLNPRAAKVVALEKPTEHEKGQWYFQRYVSHLPTRGEILFLDRSWYNRAGVERVMGFCNSKQYLEFMRQCPGFETMLVNSDIKLFKYWFSVTKKEQRARFEARAKDPLKQWKMSPVDEASVGLWPEYTKAKEAMFFYTDTAACPWTIIKSDDKKRARLNCMQHFLSLLDYPDKDFDVVTGSDPLVVGSPAQVLPEDIHKDSWPKL